MLASILPGTVPFALPLWLPTILPANASDPYFGEITDSSFDFASTQSKIGSLSAGIKESGLISAVIAVSYYIAADAGHGFISISSSELDSSVSSTPSSASITALIVPTLSLSLPKTFDAALCDSTALASYS